ncbi:MAG: hydrogenase [Acidobacteriota bacterium]
MSDADWSVRQGRRLVQLGVLLFFCGLLIGLASSNFGGAVHVFAVPRAALSAHLIALMQGTFLGVVGLLWPRLDLNRAASRIAFWLIIYGFLAACLANLLAGVWGAGGSMLPNAAGQAHGSTLQEGIIAIGLRTGAVSQIAALLLILRGLRRFADKR